MKHLATQIATTTIRIDQLSAFDQDKICWLNLFVGVATNLKPETTSAQTGGYPLERYSGAAKIANGQVADNLLALNANPTPVSPKTPDASKR